MNGILSCGAQLWLSIGWNNDMSIHILRETVPIFLSMDKPARYFADKLWTEAILTSIKPLYLSVFWQAEGHYRKLLLSSCDNMTKKMTKNGLTSIILKMLFHIIHHPMSSFQPFIMRKCTECTPAVLCEPSFTILHVFTVTFVHFNTSLLKQN